jgi:CRISPR-associated protein Csy3
MFCLCGSGSGKPFSYFPASHRQTICRTNGLRRTRPPLRRQPRQRPLPLGNRVGAEQIEIRVSRLEQGQPAESWTFDALAHNLRQFDSAAPALSELAQIIEHGLTGQSYILLNVVAYARVGDGQEIYPSQELILDKGDKKGGKSKTLYHVGDIAAIHSQKIGNALRTIDTWYPDENGDGLGPIAVEPYGSVTSQGKAYRQPKDKADFYTLLDNWVLKDKAPAPGDQHYVIATLVRGGVFGESDKE